MLEHLVRVGKYTYSATERGKKLNVIEQLIEEYKHKGKCIVIDRGYPTVQLFDVAYTEWDTRIVSTQG